MTLKYPFTKWLNWQYRDDLEGITCPGVYAIAKSRSDISRKKFTWAEEIIYFGVSKNLKKRLKHFDNTISQKRRMHGGADRVLFKHQKYPQLVPNLYVSILAVGDTPVKDSSECWRRIGEAKKLEYYCIAEYMDKYGDIPKFNREDSPKYSARRNLK